MAGFISKYFDKPWATIEKRFCDGETSKALGNEFEIPPNVIRAKASDERWRTPRFIDNEAAKLAKTGSVHDDLTHDEALLVKEMADARVKHKKAMIKLADKVYADLEERPIRIKSAHDLEKFHTVMSSTLGMEDDKDASQVTVNIGLGATPPTPARNVTPKT